VEHDVHGAGLPQLDGKPGQGIFRRQDGNVQGPFIGDVFDDGSPQAVYQKVSFPGGQGVKVGDRPIFSPADWARGFSGALGDRSAAAESFNPRKQQNTDFQGNIRLVHRFTSSMFSVILYGRWYNLLQIQQKKEKMNGKNPLDTV
jgi:hypothetical protein